jgi:hypothetical protein
MMGLIYQNQLEIKRTLAEQASEQKNHQAPIAT